MPVERRDPTVRNTFDNMGGRGAMTKTPISLQDLRRRIYAKAKAEPSWRFWGLYVHVCKLETLREAYQLAKANNGAPGVDGVTFEAIEASGLGRVSGADTGRTGHPHVSPHAVAAQGDSEGRRDKGTASSRFRRSVTVWSREPSSSSWNPSLKRTSSRVRTAIAQSALPMTPSCAWQRRL